MKSLVRVIVLTLLGCCGTQGQVISEPADVTVCKEKEEAAVFTCVLNTINNNINSDDVQWYRLVKDTGITEIVDQQDSNIHFTTSTINNTLTSQLTITSASKSHIGYYWVGTPSFNVCNASLTVTTSPSTLTVNIMKNIENSSIVVQWDAVDDSLITTYTVTWTSESGHIQVVILKEQSSYTITGLSLDTVYTVAVAPANRCGAGPEFSTSISLLTDTTSTTPSISPTVTASTNPMTIMSTANTNATITTITFTTTTTTDVTGTGTTTTTITSITIATTFAIQISTTTTTTVKMNPNTTTTISITTTVSRDTDTTSSTTMTTSLMTTTSSKNPSTTFITDPITTTPTGMLPTITANPADTTTADDTGDSSIYIIVGVIIGVIIVVTLLFIMFCCFWRRKGESNKKNEYSNLTGNGTPNKDIPMATNPLNANDEDKKPDKLEAETTQQTAEADLTNTYDKLESLQPLNPADAYDKLPPPIKAKMDSEQQQQGAMEYAVVDTSKKKQKRNEQQNVSDASDPHKDTDDGVHNDGPAVDDAHKDTYDDVLHCDVTTDTVPCNDEHTSDAANQNADNPELHYAVLQTLPPPTDAYTAKNDDSSTPYALLV